MRIGVDSSIGSFAITGGPTIALNTLGMFQRAGALKAHASFADAQAFAKTQALEMGKLIGVSPQVIRMFATVHDQILSGIESAPKSLQQAFESFQKAPSVAGAALYFNLLSDLIGEEISKSREPKPRSGR